MLTFREQKEMLVKQLQRTFGEQQGVTDPIVGILLVRNPYFSSRSKEKTAPNQDCLFFIYSKFYEN